MTVMQTLAPNFTADIKAFGLAKLKATDPQAYAKVNPVVRAIAFLDVETDAVVRIFALRKLSMPPSGNWDEVYNVPAVFELGGRQVRSAWVDYPSVIAEMNGVVS